MQKIKEKLQIELFAEVTEKLNRNLEQISAKKYVVTQILTFGELISNATSIGKNS